MCVAGIIYLCVLTYFQRGNPPLFSLIILALILTTAFVGLLNRGIFKLKVVLLYSSFLLCLYLAEISLTLFAPYRTQQDLIRRHVSDHDQRSFRQVLRDLRDEGGNAWPVHAPSDYNSSSATNQLYPLANVANASIVLDNETGRYVVFPSDEFGFNNPRGAWSNSPRGRVAIIGDSFTEGFGVDREFNIAERMNATRPTINLGRTGNGPLINLAVLKEYASIIKPDVVVWLHYEGNDLIDLGRERKASHWMRYLTEGAWQNLHARQSVADQAVKDHLTDKYSDEVLAGNEAVLRSRAWADRPFFRLARLWQLRKRVEMLATRIIPPPPDDLFFNIIAEAERSVSTWSKEAETSFYFAYLPAWRRFSKSTIEREESQRSIIIGRLTEMGIPVIDGAALFSNTEDPLAYFPFRSHGHYNEAGYKLMADTIIDHLKPNN